MFIFIHTSERTLPATSARPKTSVSITQRDIWVDLLKDISHVSVSQTSNCATYKQLCQYLSDSLKQAIVPKFVCLSNKLLYYTFRRIIIEVVRNQYAAIKSKHLIDESLLGSVACMFDQAK